MKTYTPTDLRRALAETGIAAGETVFVHASLLALGQLEGATGAEAPRRMVAEILAHLGPEGTLAVPAFNFGFCGGHPFDRRQTPSKDMGVLAETVRTWPAARRSSHPMQSVAAVGRFAAEVCEGDTPSSFSAGGAFDRLLALDARLLLLGVTLHPVSFIHYVEERQAVPYRYWKTFTAPYTEGNHTAPRSYQMYVRDKACELKLDLNRLAEPLRRSGDLREAALGMGMVRTCPARAFVRAATRMLGDDPFALLADADIARAHYAGKGCHVAGT